VMVEVNCETDVVGRAEPFRNFPHEIALQIAAAAPLYVSENEIPADVIQHESDIAAAKARSEGKAETVVPRIVEGSLKKYKDETVLLRQAYIRDDSTTIQDLLNSIVVSTGENIIIRRFVRWERGEKTAQE